jgi:hypothetical protein
MLPPADAIKYRQTTKLTPFHAADPRVSAKTGREDAKARNVHNIRSNEERLGFIQPSTVKAKLSVL